MLEVTIFNINEKIGIYYINNRGKCSYLFSEKLGYRRYY